MPDSVLHMAYGAGPSHPNASIDWKQFEPLVGIPAVDPRDVTPYAEHWMVSFERQFSASTLGTLSYVGASSHHLLVLEEANPADPALCLGMGPTCGPFNEQAARTQFGPAFGNHACCSAPFAIPARTSRSAEPFFTGIWKSLASCYPSKFLIESVIYRNRLILWTLGWSPVFGFDIRWRFQRRVFTTMIQHTAGRRTIVAQHHELRVSPERPSRWSTTTTPPCWEPFRMELPTTASILRNGPVLPTR